MANYVCLYESLAVPQMLTVRSTKGCRNVVVTVFDDESEQCNLKSD